jgi:hypothetical protein
VTAEEVCLACGLCCSGALFGHVLVTPEEGARLGRRLPILEGRFLQPCAAHEADGRCAVYEERPWRCREFACLVLRDVRAGWLPEGDAAALVAQARALAASLRARTPGAGHLFGDLDAFIEDSPAWRRAHAELLLDVGALRALLRRFVA